MRNKYICIVLLLCLVLFSSSDAKGGRGGGGGRGGRSSSGRGWGGSRRSSTSSTNSYGGSSHYGGSNHYGGGGSWFRGMFHSTPQYTYRPVFLTRSTGSSYNSIGSGTHNTRVEEYDTHTDNNYAIGYIISRGLSSDFFSIFNVVHGIAQYPDKIKKKEIVKLTSTTTTTESPVVTYSLQDTFAIL